MIPDYRFSIRQRGWMYSLSALVVTAALLAGEPAVWAQQPIQAVIDARPVEAAVVKEAATALRFTNDSEVNSRLEPIVVQLLAELGYPVDTGAELEIVINTDLQTSGPGRRVGLRGSAGDSSYGEVGVQIKSPFKRADRRPAVTTYRVSVDLRGANRLPLWRGSAAAEATGADRYAVTRGLLSALLERIGKAVENEIVFIN